MVKPTKDGFVVEFDTPTPADIYVETFHDLVNVLQSNNAELRGDENYFHLLELVRNMIPTADQAELMFEDMD